MKKAMLNPLAVGEEFCDGMLRVQSCDKVCTADLQKILRSLPDPQKLLVLLICYDKLSSAKTAKLLDISEKRSVEQLTNIIRYICSCLDIPQVDVESISSAFSAEIESQAIDEAGVVRIRTFISENLNFSKL